MTRDTSAAQKIVTAVQEAVRTVGLQDQMITDQVIGLEKPADSSFGDYATSIALRLHKAAKQHDSSLISPRVLAEKLATELAAQLASDGTIAEVTVAGPGFINFRVSDAFYMSKMLEIVSTGAKMPQIEKTGKTAIVEYSSPNIAKPFTIGHLRSTIIGAAVANLLEAVGYTVYRDNHLGDWGTQFGKQIYAIKNLGAGSEAANIAKIENSPNPVKELVALYVEFHEQAERDPALEDEGRAWFAKLEQGDPEARALWQRCIDWSFVEFERIYQKLGVSFYDGFAGGRGLGESFFEDKMQVVLDELEETLAPKGQYGSSKGAHLVFFPSDELPPLMILKQDGSTLYATRDLATDRYRKELFGDEVLIVNEVGAEQSLYFKQIYRTEELLGWFKPEQRVHVQHGLYRFKDKKMSTRKGNVIWLEEVLTEATERAQALARDKKESLATSETPKSQQTDLTDSLGQAETIGIGALKWNDLKRSAHLNVTFDWDEILNMQGNSGPYMLYTYVRTQSILHKLKNNSAISFDTLLNTLTYDAESLLADEKEILRVIARYFDVVEVSASEFAPHHLCTYLYELAQAFNAYYNKEQILQFEGRDLTETSKMRVILTAAVGSILQAGLNILGIKTVEKM